jgi:hypothetical protein
LQGSGGSRREIAELYLDLFRLFENRIGLGCKIHVVPDKRANGSRECAPDDRLREAIHLARKGRMDCFVASLLAMTVLATELSLAV